MSQRRYALITIKGVCEAMIRLLISINHYLGAQYTADSRAAFLALTNIKNNAEEELENLDPKREQTAEKSE